MKNALTGCVLVLCLGLFLNFREIRVDHLELNGVADKYVLAQTEFEFPDIEATRLLKQESIRDLGKIYYIQDTDVFKAEKKIHSSLVDRPFWRHELPSISFEEQIQASETLRDVLLKVKFADQRTLGKLRQMGQFSKNYVVYPTSEEILGDDSWEQIEQAAFLVRTPATQFILQQYKNQPWSLQEDLEKQHFLSHLIKDSIPLKMTKVLPGSRIINAGDKITLRHIAMLKGMKKKLLAEQQFFNVTSLLGSFGLALLMVMMAWTYLKTLYPHALQSSEKKALMATVVIFALLVAKVAEYFLVNRVGYLADLCRFPVFVPLVTIMLAILIDRKVAMIISLFVSLILATSLIVHYQHFLLINVTASLVATILVKTVRKRKEIFEICAKVWLVTLPFILGVNLLERMAWDYHILIDMLTSLVSMTLTGVLVVTILPILESTFGVVTDMTLLESADLSHPLLRRLNLEAPGTYRHSLSVAALAEEAALAINANPIFCRVASLYHDIGKLSQPQYFTENQFCGFNMHQLLTPLESAQVIIAHVSEGVKLAEQYELPPSLIDVIQEHHGTGLVYYFYHAQIEESRAKAVVIEECCFRYPGPTPRSRESAIIMIADSVEAAFRAMEEVSEKAVGELVESIVSDKVREHQLDTSKLTFDELEGIKKAMIRSLISNAHSRIKYPEKPVAVVWKTEEAFVQLR
ncbi:MAG TPA: HDIG domain-containing protein [Rhabdochlamydiaceae bacterium]|nr:HDIG domain-containing protein [Rhabdochlamydiaceae bacterium]